MKKIYTIIFFLFAISPFLNAQSKLHIFTDYSLFKYSDTKSILELYFSVNQRDLSYITAEGNFLGQANIDIQIQDKSNDKIVYENSVGLQSKVKDTNKTVLANKLIGQQNLTLPASEYVLKILGYDNNDKTKKDSSTYEFTVVTFDSSKTCISDLELATNIMKSDDTKSIFYKYGLEITPNPDALFGMNLNHLRYYFEIYSINKNFPGDSIFLEATVIDKSNNILMKYTKHEKPKHTAFVETGSFNTDSLNSDSYILKIKLIDLVSGYYVEKEKKFYVYNISKNISSNVDEEKDYLLSEYKTMSLEKLEDEYNKAIYIRTSLETDNFKKLKDLDEKRKFMFNFWKKRRIDQGSPVNTYKLDYFKKVNEANLWYKQGFMDGWKSDKGRIYIIYGKPSEIDNHPNESESKAYEIWTYSNVQGGAVCVFAEYDLGTGVYYLVHSTIRGEFRDDDWRDKLTK